jgi:hypothetical protein
MVEPMGFESASYMETKELCGAPWPSKVLKGKKRNSYCPLIAPKNERSISTHRLCRHSLIALEG